MHYPKITQPTHVKWEELTSESNEQAPSKLANGISHLTNGVHHVNLNGAAKHEPSTPTIFTPISRVISRNFLVVDTKYESPPISGLGIPGPDGDVLDVGPNGLPDVSDDILAELPPDCRKAFEDAKAKEAQWRQNWGNEVQDGARGKLKIGFLGYPV
jgi:chromatin structure-remodeling complex protein RSC7